MVEMLVELRSSQYVDYPVLEAGGSLVECDKVDFAVSADESSAGMRSSAYGIAPRDVQFVEAEHRFRIAVSERTELAEILKEIA